MTVAAIKHPDGTIDLPVTVHAPGLTADGIQTLRPGDPGYDEADADTIPADQHPLLRPRDMRRAAELDAMFARWDARATA